MELDGSAAMVTGAASGLGAATARLLAARGMHVVVVDLDEVGGPGVASEVGGRFVRADVADPEQVQRAVEAAVSMAPLRVLVNCAGIARAERTLDRDGTPLDLAGFELVLRVNLLGTVNCIRLAAAAMSRNEPLPGGERGAIVNTASIAAFEGQIGQVAYAASKGGIVAMTLPLARDLAAIGVRVNTVAPGLIDTPIYGQGPEADQFKEHLGRNVPFPPRLGRPPEVASLVVELLTNGYMNGQTVRIDGAVRLPPR